jgi:hypothetical protein
MVNFFGALNFESRFCTVLLYKLIFENQKSGYV